MDYFIKLIQEERARQDRVWGQQDHDDLYWFAILMEEVGEVAKALVKGKPTETRVELIQVSAVAVAWLESTER